MKQKYSIGLDIGVSSVGWACMTADFRIPKHNGRYAIGVRELEAAETAEARRIQRGTRRRYNRRIRRLQLLQQTLSPLFHNDPGFFMETDEKERHFWRNSNQFERNSLSETLKRIGENPRNYPTIYHLRDALIKHQDEKYHPRLIYIALHNLVKFRGHFLNENMSWMDSSKDGPLHEKVLTYLKEFDSHFYDVSIVTEEKVKQAAQIMEQNDMTSNDKLTAIVRVVGQDFRYPLRLLLGLKTNLQQLFPSSENIQLYKDEKLGISFRDEDIEEVMEKLTDSERIIIELAQIIYQEVILQDLLGTANCVSEAKVTSYDQFGEDLKTLKQIYNDYFGEKAYRDMFITTRKNQTEYHNTRKQNLLCTFDQFLRIHKTEDKFYRDLTRKLKSLVKDQELSEKEMEDLNDVIDRLEKGQFLQKQRSKENAAIPHQNNIYEAETILKNQQKFYPEITNEMIEKVKEIIRFRIPYYIGPLVKDNQNAPFGWVVRKSQDRVLPWTIDDVIDRSESAEQFINRMTSFCAYLTDEKVLPKHSLTYEMFEVLNELNGIQIRPHGKQPHRKYRLGADVKKWVIENVFQKYKNVTHRRLLNELKKSDFKHIVLDQNGERLNQVYGTQKEDRFGTSLSTYIDMKRIFGKIDETNKKMLEEIIYWISVFEEKDILALKIKEKYSQITVDQIRSLQNLNYTGWGRLSKRLIDELIADRANNWTILDIMKKETLVFMEVLSIEKYDLKERITKMNTKDQEKFTKIRYKDIEDLQGSPAIKKGIWQAVLIIEELVEIFGEPEHIMIEFAREDEANARRTSSRKKQITDIHRAITRDEKELKDFLKECGAFDENKFQDNRFYLYVTQGGKCLYSGESLNINLLHEYEVDHILPRSFVKDDSIDNLALVKQHMNQAKGGDKMPLEVIPKEDRFKQQMYWEKLLKNNLISQQKYFRLMKESFTDQDKESFFARQLVETRQITRHVRDLLNERFEHTEIHPVNANIVTNLREHSGAIKIRELNNKHHAVDAAFANLIVQFIIKKYGENFLNFNFKYQEARKKWRKMLTEYRKNFFLFADIVRDNNFIHYQTGEIINGHQFLHMINDEIPWQTTKKVGSGEAAFYDETIYSPRDTKGRNPQYQSSKIAKGVHSGLKVDSSYIISYKFINNRNQEKIASDIVNFLVIEKYQTKGYTDKQLAIFLAKKVARGEVIDATIHTKVLKHQLILVDNHPLYFVSSGEMNNAKQFRPDRGTLKILYQVIKKEEITKDLLQQTFERLVKNAIEQFESYLPESRINNMKEYINKVVDQDSFDYGLEELLKMSGASASRSNIFGGRYERKLNPQNARFIHQSITGLYHRKPKSYKHELWSK